MKVNGGDEMVVVMKMTYWLQYLDGYDDLLAAMAVVVMVVMMTNWLRGQDRNTSPPKALLRPPSPELQ